MKAYDVLSEVAIKNGITLSRLAINAGMSKSYTGAIKKTKSEPRVDTMSKLLQANGYTLCAIPNDAIPNDAIIIDAQGD